MMLSAFILWRERKEEEGQRFVLLFFVALQRVVGVVRAVDGRTWRSRLAVYPKSRSCRTQKDLSSHLTSLSRPRLSLSLIAMYLTPKSLRSCWLQLTWPHFKEWIESSR